MEQLRVLFQGRPVGTLERAPDGALSLAYDADAVERRTGFPLLSVTLRTRAQPYEGETLRAFLEGLLPEETLRDRVCRRYGLNLDDTFGLLRAIGGDCAGAISFVEPEAVDAWQATRREVSWLSEDDLYAVIDELPLKPFGDDDTAGIRISLAGAQNKLAVVVGEDGRVGLPVGSTPSTHILKPPSTARTGSGRTAFPWLVENELFCLRLAQHAGIRTARAAIRQVHDLRVLLVERYDRGRNPQGDVFRLHQEDLCQALGISPTRKYERDGGPSINAAVELLRRVSTQATDVVALLERIAFNTLIGNNDAHGKNAALLHTARGVQLAPLYDSVSTIVYERLGRSLAMAIGGQWQWDQVTARHWWQQLDAAGFSTAATLRRVSAVTDHAISAWDQTMAEAEEEGFVFPLLPQVRAAMDTRAPALRELTAFVPRGRRRRR